MSNWKEEIQNISDAVHGGTSWREPTGKNPSYEPYADVDTERSGNSKPWFLTCLPPGYSLGGLIDEMGFSQGLVGQIQQLERIIGAILTDNKVTGFDYPRGSDIYRRLPFNPESLMGSFSQSMFARGIAFHLYSGHLRGIRSYQEQSDLKLLQWIADKTLRIDDEERNNRALQIQTAYHCLPQNLLQAGRQFLQDNKTFVDLSADLTSPQIEVPFPKENILFPFFIPEQQQPAMTPVPAPLAIRFEKIIARTTLERLKTIIEISTP